MDFLLSNLRPDFLLIDDVDKANADQALATLLDVLERFKSEHPHVTVIMTANMVSGFDHGMLRPGRIDTFVEFKLPRRSERGELLRRYGVDGVSAAHLLERATKGLSHDYVRELALALKHEALEDVLETARTMRRLLAATKPPPAATAPAGAPAPTKAGS